ncbi:MAG: D-alanine--D-alanine ligase [Firmicutes bacterium]|nr:D-alanine--D-alanine ligase [Bacillota bacterium]
MNVLVLAGGYSAERDVSLVSGSKIVEALRRKGHRAMLLDPYMSIEAASSFEALYGKYAREAYDFAIPASEPDLARLKADHGNGEDLLGRQVLEACKLADVVFLGLHGACGENGQLQAAFDLFDIRYTGSGYVGCMLSMDKAIAKAIMELHGVRTPRGREVSIEDASADEIKLPAVIKPCSGGSSLGVTIVKEKAEVERALQYAKAFEGKVLIEEYIAGREFTVGILEGRALPVLEIRPKQGFFDYANKYQDDLTEEICPASIPEELAQRMQDIALRAHRALRLGDYSRADFIADSGGELYCLEVNTLPGMTPASLVPREARAAGISYDDLCEKLVRLALVRGR